MVRSPNLKNILLTLVGIGVICVMLVVGAQMAGIGIQSWVNGGVDQPAGPEQRSNEQIDAQIAQLERDAGEFNRREQATLPQGQDREPGPPQTEQPAPEQSPLERELEERALNELRRREERRLAALSSPIGESLHSIDSIRSARQKSVMSGDTPPTTAPPAETSIPVANVPGPDTYSLNRPGQILLAAGSIIPGALIDEIRSELPGEFRAMVTNDVYGTIEPDRVVIPRGSVITGTYGNRSAVGQRRLLVDGVRIRFPDGQALDIEGSTGVDADGSSGLKGRRRTGFLSAVLGTALVSFAENAGRRNTSSSDIADAARIASGAAVGTIANSYFGELLAKGPTFDVKAARIANIRLSRDVYFDKGTSR